MRSIVVEEPVNIAKMEFNDQVKEWYIKLVEWCLDEGTSNRDIIRVKKDKVHEFLDIEDIPLFKAWLLTVQRAGLILSDWDMFPWNVYQFEVTEDGLDIYDQIMDTIKPKKPIAWGDMGELRAKDKALYTKIYYLKYIKKGEFINMNLDQLLDYLKSKGKL